MKINIDRGGCISCGLCEATCPAVFRIADDGVAEVWRAGGRGRLSGLGHPHRRLIIIYIA